MTNTVLKAFKYRIYPNKEQEKFLLQNFGCVRFVWNQLVANFNSFSKDGPNRPMNEKILKDNENFPWLKEAISYALQQKRIDFDETKKQFFSKNRKAKLGRPKFKKRGGNESFRIPAASMHLEKFEQIKAGFIKLPKMPPVKVIIDRPFAGKPKSVTISKNPSGQYFVSILVEEEIELKQNTGRSIGIDLGLKNLLILSDGTQISNPRWFRENQSKLKRAQQHLSRKTKGSKRYNRQKIKVAKIYRGVTNQRKFIYHNLSSWLIENYDVICTETLKVKNMVRNRSLAKSILDASWATFISMLEYKSRWYGRTLHKIDTWFPSSKTCSCCGHKMEAMDLSVREWTCPTCGSQHDRDLNAAINILNEGVKDLYDMTSAELTEYRRGEAIRPEEVLPKAASVKRLVSFIKIYRTA
jgi:putative transposase